MDDELRDLGDGNVAEIREFLQGWLEQSRSMLAGINRWMGLRNLSCVEAQRGDAAPPQGRNEHLNSQDTEQAKVVQATTSRAETF
ncbi:hypothetical protein [Pseudorhodoferax soli]|uniref:hypothetical protein n=1 Tax=Pseudorhodoferax soli TaxID=545864 RepID=UPI0011C02C75|nr:hypothetical protein [Pseudorhodoferax soli]